MFQIVRYSHTINIPPRTCSLTFPLMHEAELKTCYYNPNMLLNLRNGLYVSCIIRSLLYNDDVSVPAVTYRRSDGNNFKFRQEVGTSLGP
jgi:hypothetical protein